MHLLINPYNWQQINPDLFYGSARLNLTSELVKGLSNGQSFGITGGRRMGKTTLLRRVEKELMAYGSKARSGGLLIIPIYIETLTLPFPLSPDIIYREIARLLNIKLFYYKVACSSSSQIADSQTFKDYLFFVINSVLDYRVQAIFIFDEIELICKSHWGSNFFANWRSLLSNTPEIHQYVSAIFSGADEMFKISRDIGSPLGNVLEWRELELFSLKDTSQLVCEPTQYRWAESFIEEIYSSTGGHPFLIQYLMQTICNHDNENYFQSLEYAKHHFLKSQKIQFQNWWDKFDGTTRAIYARLAEVKCLTIKAIFSEFGNSSERSLSILNHTGVVCTDWEADTLSIAGSLFQEWFVRFGNLDVTPDLASRVDELLKEVERKLRKFLNKHFDSKKSTWLQNHFKKGNVKKWEEILKRADKPQEALLSNNEVLKNSDLGDLFELTILGSEWNELFTCFTNLSSDKNQAKSRFVERKDHLIPIRNKLRHVREDEIDPTALLKAQVFCMELLELLSFDDEQS